MSSIEYPGIKYRVKSEANIMSARGQIARKRVTNDITVHLSLKDLEKERNRKDITDAIKIDLMQQGHTIIGDISITSIKPRK